MKKALKLAGIFGIIHLVVMVFLFIAVSFLIVKVVFSGSQGSLMFQGNETVPVFPEQSFGESFDDVFLALVILSIVGICAYIVFLTGFIALGRRFNNKLLSTAAWILIIVQVVSIIAISGLFISGTNLFESRVSSVADSSFTETVRNDVDNPVFSGILAVFNPGVFGFWAFLVLLGIFSLTVRVLFIIGIFKLRDRVSLSLASGIFESISIIIGLAGGVAILLETIMFFKASSSFEEHMQRVVRKPRSS